MRARPVVNPEADLRRFLAAIRRGGPAVTQRTLAQATQIPLSWIPWYEAMAIDRGLLIVHRRHRSRRSYYLTPAALALLDDPAAPSPPPT